MLVILIPILAGLASIMLHLAALKLFPKIRLLDFPDRYGISRKRLPYPTGILTVILFLISYFFLEEPSILKKGIIMGVTVLGITNFIDDRKQLSPIIRLIIQILVAVLLFAAGARIYSITNPLSVFLETDVFNLSQWIVTVPLFGSLPLLSGLFTLLWILLTINALNWFDGIPGQTSVIAGLGFLTLGVLSISSRVDDHHLALFCFILAALALGALPFELPQPKVIPGDTGAMFYGLMLGILTLYSGQGKVATAFLVLGLPIIDLGIVIIRRLLKYASPFHGNDSDEHLHHRLLARGWNQWQIIFLTASLGIAFGITALFLNTLEKFIAALILGLIVLCLSLYSIPRKLHS